MAFLPEPLADDLPGALCLAFGLMMLVEAVRRAIAAHAAPLPIGPDRTLAFVRRLRLVLVGGALSGACQMPDTSAIVICVNTSCWSLLWPPSDRP